MANPTYYAKLLVNELEKRGIKARLEYEDGYKSVDIHIPEVNLDIEVDGTHHMNDPEQAFRDLVRTKFSLEDGRNTVRIPNTLAYNKPGVTADIIKEIVTGIKEKQKLKPDPLRDKGGSVKIEENTSVGEIISSDKKEDILNNLRKAGRITKKALSFSYRLLLEFLKNSLKLLVFLFILPVVYYIFSYALFFLVAIITAVVSMVLGWLFAKNSEGIAYVISESFVGDFAMFVKNVAPIIWKFIYSSQTRPLLVITTLVISLILSYSKLKNIDLVSYVKYFFRGLKGIVTVDNKN
ncbi:MAG: hypothetical protein KKD18_01900 [Nanoarchaeota archaeon]|nr:hypothetical protein [Nanoarchaeota archaeon]